ncbi:VOC family protein [Thalassotalea crassostreae]|uniref:VOC family protein n=1 Tax=Thalassotalea crassostreae TaxID=1763536 RepID=UPI0008384910|nr:VOC family protein [Thalassotalea crassostreae]
MEQHHKISYLELPAKDIGAIKSFYQRVFDFKFVDYGDEYSAFNDGNINGGFYQSDAHANYQQGAPLIVFYSDNLEDSVDKVTEHGGKIVQPIFSFPGGRRFHFTDPSQNELAVWSDK